MSDNAPRTAVPSRGVMHPHVVDGLPMPVVISRVRDDTVLRVNPEFQAAYGYDPAEVADEVFRDLHFVAEDRDDALSAFASGELASVEVRIRDGSGTCRWAQADVSRFDMEGEPVLLTTLYDIGAKKAAQREAAEGAAFVEEMARFPEMNPGPVLRLDLDGAVHRANEAARRTVGKDSLVGMDFRALCPALDDEVWARVLEGGDPVVCEDQIGEAHFSFTIAHEAGTDQVFVFGSDVTELKEAQRELAERARFPAMNPGPVARTDRTGTVLRANRAAAKAFGVDTIQGACWFDICPGMDEARWTRILDGTDSVHHEAELDGRSLSFTFRHEPISDQVFIYGSDVTELKVAERALAELARFPDMNPGPVLRLDRSGTVLLANPAARQVLGHQDIEGRSWLELCPGLDADFWGRVCAADSAVVTEATIGGRHFVLTHAPGPEGIFVFVYGSDVTEQKSAETALRQSEKMATLGTLAAGVAHELNNPAAATQRAAEQLETKLVELKEAQLALRATELPGNPRELLDELEQSAQRRACNPMQFDALDRSDREADVEEWLEAVGAIDAWEMAPALVDLDYDRDALDALAQQVGAGAAPAVLAWQAKSHAVFNLLDEIRQGSARLVEIVGAMKAYAYLGQAPLQNVDVNDGLKNTLVILRSKLKKGITVRKELAPDLPRIQAYGSDLNQVWTNLLDNASDAMDGEGTIVLRSRQDGDRIVVEIEDDGPGIPPHIQSRVFDAFFTTKPPGKGTGLGLNTTYKIVVQKHGGAIHLDSEPGRTRFTVELPMTAKEPDQ